MPGAVAQRFLGTGTLIFVRSDEDELETQLDEFRAAGFSNVCIGLLRFVHEAGIDYVDIHADGEVVDGLPVFDW